MRARACVCVNSSVLNLNARTSVFSWDFTFVNIFTGLHGKNRVLARPLFVSLFVCLFVYIDQQMHSSIDAGRVDNVVLADRPPRYGGVMVKTIKDVANQGQGHHHGVCVFRSFC